MVLLWQNELKRMRIESIFVFTDLEHLVQFYGIENNSTGGGVKKNNCSFVQFLGPLEDDTNKETDILEINLNDILNASNI